MHRPFSCVKVALVVTFAAFSPDAAFSTEQEQDQATEQGSEQSSDSAAPSWKDRIWISGQVNSITQYHPAFRAAYTGESSIQPNRELASSRVLTLFTGVRLTSTTELILHVESAGGSGISNALGIAGATNLDVVRNPTLGSKPYLGRYMVRQIVPLSKETEEAQSGPLGVTTRVPVRRLEFRFGKLSTADFFDINSVGSDSHLQFMNWTVDNNGGYDFAADTRGYTYGAVAEFYNRGWAVRFMEALVPMVANGLQLDWSLARARSENAEFELRRGILPKRPGVIRFLGYVNHANMGSYRDAIRQFENGLVDTPDVTATRRQGRAKYGFGVNVEQQVARNVLAFGRWGWNEGHHESFMFTEVNQSVAGGVRIGGERWRRTKDVLGFAMASNAVSGDHRRYLELGGMGFLLGDGALRYGREHVVEVFYRLNIGRGFSISPDFQRIASPGYNQDRGPVSVASLRLHMEIDKTTLRGER